MIIVRINDMVKASFNKESMAGSSGFRNGEPITKEKAIALGLDLDHSRNITGSSAHKKIVPVDESVKQKILDITSKEVVENFAMSDGEAVSDVIRGYLDTLPSEERSSANWTLQCFTIQVQRAYVNEIKSHNLSWTQGEYFDPKILEGFNPMQAHLDITV